jgi:hypothetical protein
MNKPRLQPVEGCQVIVGFPDGEQVRGIVVAQWDNTWYHIRFLVDADCRYRDQVGWLCRSVSIPMNDFVLIRLWTARVYCT